MQKGDGREKDGMMKLLGYYKALFRTPENLNHYSEVDLRVAEKKFLKSILFGFELNSPEGRTLK